MRIVCSAAIISTFSLSACYLPPPPVPAKKVESLSSLCYKVIFSQNLAEETVHFFLGNMSEKIFEQFVSALLFCKNNHEPHLLTFDEQKTYLQLIQSFLIQKRPSYTYAHEIIQFCIKYAGTGSSCPFQTINTPFGDHAYTLLQYAVEKERSLSATRFLLHSGADPNFHRGSNSPPILMALADHFNAEIKAHYENIIDELLAHQAIVNDRRYRVLYTATRANRRTLIEKFLKAGANPRERAHFIKEGKGVWHSTLDQLEYEVRERPDDRDLQLGLQFLREKFDKNYVLIQQKKRRENYTSLFEYH